MLRIGLLGAAKIAPNAIVAPARSVPEVSLVSVAARDPARAREFAAKHGIARIHDSYDTMIADPEIDALYIPLPNGLHGRWAIKAAAVGKHVLCEKPIAANAQEAAAMAEAARKAGTVLMEAFHYRYHPLAARLVEIIASGELGELKHVRATMCFPLPLFKDIRYNFALAGGAMMDAGCYAVNMARLMGGPDPEVVAGTPKLLNPDVDRAMEAQLRFKSGATGTVTVSMWSMKLLNISCGAVGTLGEVSVFNPVAPQAFHRLTVKTAKGKRTENLGDRPTYLYQLEAFTDACIRGKPFPTTAEDGIVNMRVIDDIYRAAGMQPRHPAA
jgi:predicted dehydrogenase